MFLKISDGFLKNGSVFFINNFNLRPTKNFVRKMLFVWINPFIKNAKILDLFAGSGILGFESVSVGAKKVYFFEIDDFYTNILLRNISNFNTCKYFNVFNINSFLWVKNIIYLDVNIIFFDPPYNNFDLLISMLNYVSKINFNNIKVLIYIESIDISILNKLPYHWVLLYIKKTGNVNYFLLRIIK